MNRCRSLLFVWAVLLLTSEPAAGGHRIMVAPSGDPTGFADAFAIEGALSDAGPGDTVVLSDGDRRTVDHYYVNRVLVAVGFTGTLIGEGRETTVVEAIPNDPSAYTYNSAYIPECPLGSPPWAACDFESIPNDSFWPALLHFEWPGDWAIRNIKFTVSDPVPPIAAGDPREHAPRCFGFAPGECPREFQVISVMGGNGTSTVTDSTFAASLGTTALVYGPSIKRGSPRPGPIDGTGDVQIKDCHFESMQWGPIIMWHTNSRIVLKGLTTYHVAAPVYLERLVFGQTTLKDNVFVESIGPVVQLRHSPHTTITGNVFKGVDQLQSSFRAPIYIRHRNVDVTVKDNVFHDIRNVHPATPSGAIYVPRLGLAGDLLNVNITIKDNQYDPEAFAIRLGADSSLVVEEGLDSSQVVDFGTGNVVRVGND